MFGQIKIYVGRSSAKVLVFGVSEFVAAAKFKFPRAASILLTDRILVLKRQDTINAALIHLSSFNMFAGSSPIPFDDSMNPRFLL